MIYRLLVWQIEPYDREIFPMDRDEDVCSRLGHGGSIDDLGSKCLAEIIEFCDMSCPLTDKDKAVIAQYDWHRKENEYHELVMIQIIDGQEVPVEKPSWLREQVHESLRNAQENGFNPLGQSDCENALDLVTYDADLEDRDVGEIERHVREWRTLEEHYQSLSN